MDRQAARWVAILDNEDIDKESQLPVYPEAAKDRIFNRLQAWLKERKRLFPEEAPKEGPGVTSMREWLNDPEAKGELEAMIRKIATPAAVKPRTGPTRDKTADTNKQAEGSALHALVFDAEGLEQDQ